MATNQYKSVHIQERHAVAEFFAICGGTRFEEEGVDGLFFMSWLNHG